MQRIKIVVHCPAWFVNPGLRIRAWREVQKTVMEAAALQWWRQYAPRHFSGEQTKYQYQARKPSYLESRTKKGKPLLCLTFETYRAIVKTTPMVKAYPTRAVMTFTTPHYVSMTPTREGLPNYGVEITRVPFDEQLELVQFMKEQHRNAILRARYEQAVKEIS
jgi:hypothetical protein